MTLEELVEENKPTKESQHVFSVLGGIFLSILCPFLGLPLLAMEYASRKKTERDNTPNKKRIETNPYTSNTKQKYDYTSLDEYFNKIYNWIRNRSENEKEFIGYYNANGQNRQISIQIS